MLTEIKFGTKVENKKNGVFVAVTAKSKIYQKYNDPNMTKEYKNALYPLVLMVHRWDGKMGFPGGFVDSGENLAQAAIRELDEETGIVALEQDLVPVCSHESDNIIVHAYHMDFGELDIEALKTILSCASNSKDVVSEGCPIWVHLSDYGRNKGLKTTLQNNTLALAVKEELEAILNRIK